ncbi:uncharacterized protein LOC125505142 [Dendroctonus ponderosae]|uniref:uncharacterized protein LOC125505142 n=1 Tax=Dendroctonus ponderosae TaxID=77166 RepID=UPI00203523FA|nr:uncharacterized protein LOC125505142 [Dendroctonus ponderosae]KAH1013035.1 hypothetical protein HUJ05_012089 [Dendroctonus ponderosae]
MASSRDNTVKRKLLNFDKTSVKSDISSEQDDSLWDKDYINSSSSSEDSNVFSLENEGTTRHLQKQPLGQGETTYNAEKLLKPNIDEISDIDILLQMEKIKCQGQLQE